jgi:hypothetical protein
MQITEEVLLALDVNFKTEINSEQIMVAVQRLEKNNVKISRCKTNIYRSKKFKKKRSLIKRPKCDNN